jgi:hypothetical protein
MAKAWKDVVDDVNLSLRAGQGSLTDKAASPIITKLLEQYKKQIDAATGGEFDSGRVTLETAVQTEIQPLAERYFAHAQEQVTSGS